MEIIPRGIIIITITGNRTIIINTTKIMVKIMVNIKTNHNSIKIGPFELRNRKTRMPPEQPGGNRNTNRNLNILSFNLDFIDFISLSLDINSKNYQTFLVDSQADISVLKNSFGKANVIKAIFSRLRE